MGRHGPWVKSRLDEGVSSMAPGKRHPAGTEAKWAPAAAGTGLPNAIDTGIPTRQVKHLNFRPAQGTRTVAKPELGTKRLCSNCGAKFYDLSKNPTACPKGHPVLELAAAPPRSRPDAGAARAAAAPAPEEEVV